MRQISLVLGAMTFGESVFAPDVEAFLRAFLHAGYTELDTAYVYNEGRCETLLGDAIRAVGRDRVKIATKIHPRVTGRLDGAAARMQLNASLTRLGVSQVDTLYLHFPDPVTPVEDVLSACQELHEQGKFRELGLSNFPAWLMAEAWYICDKHGWVKPTVYEGMYNPLTRGAEAELNRALDHFGLRYYAYNPLAGGLLTGRYGRFEDTPDDGRFTHRPNYQNRYWKKSYFEAVDALREACGRHAIPLADAVYRWMAFHSMLSGDRGDAIIVGASKLSHLTQNLAALGAGPLPQDLVAAFDEAWARCRADSPAYFTFYQGAAK
ncbi:MAG: aldo/keto reductase [Clostridia bacterium]|nr:aldo/keto reductase [Clostridia bacterium]